MGRSDVRVRTPDPRTTDGFFFYTTEPGCPCVDIEGVTSLIRPRLYSGD